MQQSVDSRESSTGSRTTTVVEAAMQAAESRQQHMMLRRHEDDNAAVQGFGVQCGAWATAKIAILVCWSGKDEVGKWASYLWFSMMSNKCRAVSTTGSCASENI